MSKKLVIYLIDSTEYGPKSAEIGNWSGKAIYSQRSAIGKIINREEFNNPGIYCLKSTPEDPNYSERIYIGESENIGTPALYNRILERLALLEEDDIHLVLSVMGRLK